MLFSSVLSLMMMNLLVRMMMFYLKSLKLMLDMLCFILSLFKVW